VQKLNPTLLALVGGVIALLFLLWFFTGRSNPDQDKLTNPQLTQAEQAENGKGCSRQATFDLIKRELFRRAAQAGGGDTSDLGQIADAAAVRMDNPVMEGEDSSSEAFNCSGTLSIDLPPGVVAAGGRRTLTADVDYSLDGTGALVQLRNTDALVSGLATLQKVAEPPEGVDDNAAAPVEENVAASVSANVEPGPSSNYPGRPSFDCSKARTRGEIAVCSDSGLSALDVNMATQYRRSMASASQGQVRQLESTRDRFLAYRDRCPNRQCIADAYLGRMREIRDIMEGRLPPR
jgi:hypothetical protein